eukprot:350228-Chlamydomonas_euryale.AAC.10
MLCSGHGLDHGNGNSAPKARFYRLLPRSVRPTGLPAAAQSPACGSGHAAARAAGEEPSTGGRAASRQLSARVPERGAQKVGPRWGRRRWEPSGASGAAAEAAAATAAPAAALEAAAVNHSSGSTGDNSSQPPPPQQQQHHHHHHHHHRHQLHHLYQQQQQLRLTGPCVRSRCQSHCHLSTRHSWRDAGKSMSSVATVRRRSMRRRGCGERSHGRGACGGRCMQHGRMVPSAWAGGWSQVGCTR